MQMLDIPRLVQTCPPSNIRIFGGTVDRFYCLPSLGLEAYGDYVSKKFSFAAQDATKEAAQYTVKSFRLQYYIVRYKSGFSRVTYEKLKCPVFLGVIAP
jgi:hypothetical protein